MKELTSKQIERLKEIYEELKAILISLPDSNELTINERIVFGYHDLVQELSKLLNSNITVDLISYKVKTDNVLSSYDKTTRTKTYKNVFKTTTFKISINRLIALLKTKYNLEDLKTLETKKIIDTIKDDELKGRCFDLLSAKGKNDRVLREATTILEHRIRTLSKSKLTQVGVALVDKVLNPNKGLLTLDAEKNEQEGYYQLFRGVMLSFRDKHHHKITDNLAEEDAIKFLATIDILLDILSKYQPR